MKIIVFDTETTGLPERNGDLAAQPYVCQFAAGFYDFEPESGKMVLEKFTDLLIKPAESIPFECTEIHGISNAMVANAPSFGAVAEQIRELFYAADIAVAHNLAFDQAILEAEFERVGLSKAFLPAQIFDTMKETRELCALPGKNPGKFKSPRLMELYQFLFGRGFEGAHNALNDVQATAECLAELYRRGVFVPEVSAQGQLF